MKITSPEYYKDFKCTADKCRHSCCVGWEIDIDEETAQFYKTVGGEIGERLGANIDDRDAPHFVLREGERCPFLNESGLCDIITELGEGALCQICADHPRFRNYFDDRVEIGLGISCEAAARLILTSDKYGVDSTEFPERERIFELLCDRNIPLSGRVEAIRAEFEVEIPELSLEEWSKLFLGMEILDGEWEGLIGNLTEHKNADETVEERLLTYFLYRHLANGIYDGRMRARIAFAIVSTFIITHLPADVFEGARMYSAEIEYSEENTERLINFLEN